MTAQQDERRHIARELHDDVNQRLALLAIGIEQASVLSGDRTVGARLHDLWVETTGISRSVHDLSRTLHSSTSGVLGLVPAIRALSRDLSAKGLRVTVVADDRGIDLPQSSTLCLFRVAQEALGNVLKHSGIRNATLTLSDTARSVRLLVEDHGRGFEPLMQHDGLGLLSMRERVAIVGGELLIRAQPGEGTVVDARVPRPVRHSADSRLFDLRRRA
jgi:signal transduction histidine kinase